jgi:hypothetical protein
MPSRRSFSKSILAAPWILRAQPSQRSAAGQGKTLQYSFPPHSFTMIRAKLAYPGEGRTFHDKIPSSPPDIPER